MKCLSTADWHIQDSTIEEAEKCLNFLIQTAEQESPDVIIHAGDTFNSGDVKLDSKAAKLVIRTFNRLADIAPVAVILGTPSHDGTAAEILSFVRGRFPIFVATKPEQLFLNGIDVHQRNWEKCFVDIEDVFRVGNVSAVISLMPAPTKQFFQGAGDIKQGDAEIAAAMSAIFAGFGATAQGFGVPHILVYHGSISGAFVSKSQVLTGVDIEISTDQMKLAHPTVACLGHVHEYQKLSYFAFYSGSLFAQNWGEMSDKGFMIHDIGDEVVSRFVKGPGRKMIRYAFDYTDPTKLKTWGIDEDAEDVAGAHVRIDATVWQDEAAAMDFDAMKAGLLRWGAESIDIRITRLPRENIRADAVLKAETLVTKIAAMAVLREELISPSILQKADALENMDAEELVKMIGKGGLA